MICKILASCHLKFTNNQIGGSIVAMVGKDCVAIASDLRLGSQSLGLSNTFEKVYNYGHVYLGLAGLATDAQTL